MHSSVDSGTSIIRDHAGATLGSASSVVGSGSSVIGSYATGALSTGANAVSAGTSSVLSATSRLPTATALAHYLPSFSGLSSPSVSSFALGITTLTLLAGLAYFYYPGSFEAAQNHTHGVKGTVEEKSQQARDYAQDKSHQVKDVVQEKSQQTRDVVQDMTQQTKEFTTQKNQQYSDSGNDINSNLKQQHTQIDGGLNGRASYDPLGASQYDSTGINLKPAFPATSSKTIDTTPVTVSRIQHKDSIPSKLDDSGFRLRSTD